MSAPRLEASLARAAGLRGTLLRFGVGTMAVVVEHYEPVNLGAPSDLYTLELWLRADAEQPAANGAELVPLVTWGGDNFESYPFALFVRVRDGALVARRMTLHGDLSELTATPDTEGLGLLDAAFHHVALVRGVARAPAGDMVYLQLFIDGETQPGWRLHDAAQSDDAHAPSVAPLSFGGMLGTFLVDGHDFLEPVGFSGELSQARVWRGAMGTAQLAALRFEALRGPLRLAGPLPSFAGGAVTLSHGASAVTLPRGTPLVAPDGTRFALVADVALSADADAQGQVIALEPGYSGDLPEGMALVVDAPSTDVTAASTASRIAGGDLGGGGEPSVGFVTVANGSDTFTLRVEAEDRVGVGEGGLRFALLAGARIEPLHAVNLPVRALSPGPEGDVTVGAIDWLAPAARRWEDGEGAPATPGAGQGNLLVENQAALTGGLPAPTFTAVGEVSFKNTHDKLTATVPAGTLLGADLGGPYFRTDEALQLGPQQDFGVHITAVDVGSAYNLPEHQITWVEPTPLIPSYVVLVRTSATVGGRDPYVQCVGCWSMDEGFGRVIYNYAAALDASPRGDGTFNAAFPALVEKLHAVETGVALPQGEPIWRITALMSPPAPIRERSTETP
ncbi:MAG: baseplate J/gp47 family protein [Alphaproteobacteria bacterium]|nr:baseplate J/gp47 family protein [Alphaproteobacteria bacterium]